MGFSRDFTPSPLVLHILWCFVLGICVSETVQDGTTTCECTFGIYWDNYSSCTCCPDPNCSLDVFCTQGRTKDDRGCMTCDCLGGAQNTLDGSWARNIKRYNSYSVIQVTPTTEEEVELLVQIMKSDQYDFWKDPSVPGAPVHIMVNPDDLEGLNTTLTLYHVTYEVHVQDVSRVIDTFIDYETRRRSAEAQGFDIDDFNTLTDIEDWLHNTLLPLCESVDGLACEMTASPFTSVEGRDIWIFKMETSTAQKTILIDSLMHAREWIAGATVLKLMDKLVRSYGSDPEATDLLKTYNFVFLPVVNPDGYEYSWTDDRLWRKNRRFQMLCDGVDLNRNYAWNWGRQTEGAGGWACREDFQGHEPLTEPEIQAVDHVMASLADNLAVYINYHSYGRLWIYPWGNTVDFTLFGSCERASNHQDMSFVAKIATSALEETHGEKWIFGTTCEVLFGNSGSGIDHAKGVYNVPFPVAIELRGDSFILDPSEIHKSFEENWNALFSLHKAIIILNVQYG